MQLNLNQNSYCSSYTLLNWDGYSMPMFASFDTKIQISVQQK